MAVVTAGEHDGGVRAEMLRAVIPTLFSRATIALIGNSGHRPMEESPVWLTTRLEKFMEERR